MFRLGRREVAEVGRTCPRLLDVHTIICVMPQFIHTPELRVSTPMHKATTNNQSDTYVHQLIRR
jgi:hypothetical protein